MRGLEKLMVEPNGIWSKQLSPAYWLNTTSRNSEAIRASGEAIAEQYLQAYPFFFPSKFANDPTLMQHFYDKLPDR